MLLVAYIREDRDDDCAVQTLVFTYNHSAGEFDSVIGNDVRLQVYQDSMLIDTKTIAYETIKGGKEYEIKDYPSGSYSFVAWALPAEDPDVATIPPVSVGAHYRDQVLEQPVSAANNTYRNSLGEIFEGESAVVLNREQTSRHEISLTTCICQVYFTLHNADMVVDAVTGSPEIWVELEGVQSEMRLGRRYGGREVTVHKDLVYDQADEILISNRIGVLESGDDQSLSATVYVDGVRICRVDTNEKAKVGDVVKIEATLNGGVTVTINGWRVKNAEYTYYV
ncbi:MAG: FimB/Mfa2 family fimbrial subunit [Bacteroides sp.]|nr:FimB/Mfa2 family fimbrial subunit [Bacteroides sp.]